MNEVTKAKAVVREKERAIWTRVEALGREARATDGAVKASAAATPGAETSRERHVQTLTSGL